jgi:hypothetical protein
MGFLLADSLDRLPQTECIATRIRSLDWAMEEDSTRHEINGSNSASTISLKNHDLYSDFICSRIMVCLKMVVRRDSIIDVDYFGLSDDCSSQREEGSQIQNAWRKSKKIMVVHSIRGCHRGKILLWMIKHKTIFLFAIFLHFSIQHIDAKSYIVDRNHPLADDDNSGTLGTPWLTIQHAAEIAEAGDTVLIRNGVYREHVSTVRDGDQAKGTIVFSAYPDERPAIDGTGAEGRQVGFDVWNCRTARFIIVSSESERPEGRTILCSTVWSSIILTCSDLTLPQAAAMTAIMGHSTTASSTPVWIRIKMWTALRSDTGVSTILFLIGAVSTTFTTDLTSVPEIRNSTGATHTTAGTADSSCGRIISV